MFKYTITLDNEEKRRNKLLAYVNRRAKNENVYTDILRLLDDIGEENARRNSQKNRIDAILQLQEQRSVSAIKFLQAAINTNDKDLFVSSVVGAMYPLTTTEEFVLEDNTEWLNTSSIVVQRILQENLKKTSDLLDLIAFYQNLISGKNIYQEAARKAQVDNIFEKVYTQLQAISVSMPQTNDIETTKQELKSIISLLGSY